MIGQQGSLGVSPAELLAAKNMASGKSNMNKEISLGGDLTRLMLAAMQLKKSQAELEKLKLTRGANPQTTVAQDVQKGIAQLQGQPEEQPQQPQQPQGQPQGQQQQMARMGSGIGGLPAGAIDNEDAFAGGGIVAFAEGDQVESKPITITPDREAFNYFISQGWTPAAAAGFVSNIQAESAFNPNSQHDFDKKTNTYIGTGLVGWNAGRRQQLEAMYGSKPTYQQQLEYLHKELSGETKDEPGTAGVGKRLRDNPNISANDAAAMLSREGIRPKDREGQAKYRGTLAEQLLTGFTGSGNANAAEPPRAAAPTGIAATLTPSELQAKSDNEALKAAGRGIKGFADSGVAALKDWATAIPRAASRAYGAVTGNEPPMTTNSWTPYSDADSAKKEDATKDGAPKGHPQSHERGKDEGADLPSVVAIPAQQRVQPQVITSDREPDYSKYSPNGRTAPAIKSLKDIANDTLYTGLTTQPLSREAYDKQVNAIAKKEGTDPASMKEFFDKQSASFTNQAVEAKKNRDVDLWMSAAQGFFAMGAGTSPRALQNFAMGAGIGVKQAQSALNEYGKAQKEINAAQRDIAKFEMSHRETRTAQQIASYDKALARADLFEARKLGIAEKVWERIIRQDEIKESRLNREYTQRRDFERKQLDDFRDTLNKDPEYSSAKKAFEGLDQLAILYKDKPAEFAAETRKIQERMKQAETRVKSGYPALGGNSGGAKFLGYE